jgi:septal ring factor EnvC (AmiA/AmiB activator)
MIDKIKAKWALYKEAWPYIRDPGRILYLRDLTVAQRELISVYDAGTWEKEVVRNLKDELDKRKAAMDEEEQAHEAAEEELQAELDKCRDALGGTIKENKHLRVDAAELTRQVADLKSRLAAALAEKAYLLQEKAEWLKEGDPNRVPSETTPADC